MSHKRDIATTCSHCDKEFSTAGNLKYHLLTAAYCKNLRGEDTTKRYKCANCMRAYTTRGALQRHVTACEASYIRHLKKNHERLKARLAKKTAQLNALTHVDSCVQPSNVSLPTLIIRKLNRVDISNIEPFTMGNSLAVHCNQ